MSSVLRKCLTRDGQAVIVALDATSLVEESMKRIQAWPPAMYHLGQALMASALLQALPDRNETEKLDLQWKVDKGVFGSVFAECRGSPDEFFLRGTVLHPQPVIEALQVPMGPGLFQVRRLNPKLQQPLSSGIVESAGDVVLDVLSYLERSEQKVCAMSLWIDIAWDQRTAETNQEVRKSDTVKEEEIPFRVLHAYGFLVTVLPQKTLEKTYETLYQWDRHILDLGPISKWVLGSNPTSDILSFVSAELEPNITGERKLSFFCTCSEDRAARALAFAENADIREGISTGPKSAAEEVRCEFCGRTYIVEAHRPS